MLAIYSVARTRTLILLTATLMFALSAGGVTRQSRVRDITEIEGVRENQLIGYGLVVGLQGTGDRQQTYFTVQTLANLMQRLGVQIPAGTAVVKNVAAVIVTAQLPAFAEPGMKLDVTVSSVGDAKSIEGGVLLLTALRGADGQVYAEAQGSVITGGYSETAAGNTRAVNFQTVARIPEGALIERPAAVDLRGMHVINFLLRNADFTTARDLADAVNADFGNAVATVIDSRRVEVDVHAAGITSIPRLISRVQNLSIAVQTPAKVVLNERTGTIVLGGDVLLSSVSLLHGGLQIQVDTVLTASQPSFGASGSTVVVPNTELSVQDKQARSIHLANGANVEELVKGLHMIGATSHDIVAILQAVKAAGGLQADLEVI
jgi:flagellar P-ring protein precursor FlgI